MSSLPLPKSFADLLAPDQGTNRSLLFDRSMDRYGEDRKIVDGGKEDFLQTFTTKYEPKDVEELRSFLRRRRQAFSVLGAESVRLFAQTRLVIGLGLPHPVETGFLLDRLTGCPYLPGSSVKGLLRAAARLVGSGELEGDRGFWSPDAIDKIFGPELGTAVTPEVGAFIFYDAFPTTWPILEVDVLTPHHGPYYGGGGSALPTDWEKPVPVPFLTVQEGTEFTFFVGPGSGRVLPGDLDQLKDLLRIALDWLGIGAKKSSGYGYFGSKPLIPPAPISQKPVGTPDPKKPKPPESPKVKHALWSNAELRLVQGTPTAYRGSQQATCQTGDLDPAVLDTLKKSKKGLRADVEVVKAGGSFRLAQVKSWKPL